MSIYAAMYYIPILVVIHALIGGLLCEYTKSERTSNYFFFQTMLFQF